MENHKVLMRDGKFTREFYKLASDSMDWWKVTSLSIVVIQDESVCSKVSSIVVIWSLLKISKGYGFARYPDVLITPETVFDYANMSKAFNPTAASFIVDDEQYPDVPWTTPVSHLIRDDFVLSDSDTTESITIGDILCHQSGLPEYIYLYMQ